MRRVYEPREYWEQRLSNRFTLRGAGHISFGASYNQWLYRRKAGCVEACLAGINLTGKSVLDIGCGTGFFVEWYLQRGATVCGIDITDVSIARLRQKYQGEFYTQDITDRNFKFLGRQFDIINMWDVIYHIVDPDRFQQALDNIAGSIKDGGLFLFTDWFGARADKQLDRHVRVRCLDTYKQFLPQMGFELVAIHPLYNHLNKVHLKLWKVNLPIVDNYLGRFYYSLDERSVKIPADNLSLGVWRWARSQP